MSPPLPSVVKKSTSSTCWNHCANCCSRVEDGHGKDMKQRCRVSAFVLRENRKDITISVTEALREVYNLYSKTSPMTSKQHLVLCYSCAVIFPPMYKLYREFSYRSSNNSILAKMRRPESLEEILEDWCTSSEDENENLRHDNTANVIEPGGRSLLESSDGLVEIIDVKPTLPQTSPLVEMEYEIPVALQPPPEETDPLAIQVKEENPLETVVVKEEIPFLSELQNVPPESTPKLRSVFSTSTSKVDKRNFSRSESHSGASPDPSSAKKPVADPTLNCPKCGRNFQTPFQVECHVVYCVAPPNKLSDKYVCLVCSMPFMSEVAWKNHTRRMHYGLVNIDRDEVESTTKAKKRKQELTLSRSETNHINVPTPAIKPTTEKSCNCTKCGRSFQTQFQLKCHLVYCVAPSNFHKLSEKYVCQVCTMSFNSEVAWKNHTQSQHYGKINLTFNCQICPAKFTWQSDLEDHMKMHKWDSKVRPVERKSFGAIRSRRKKLP